MLARILLTSLFKPILEGDLTRDDNIGHFACITLKE